MLYSNISSNFLIMKIYMNKKKRNEIESENENKIKYYYVPYKFLNT